jgi:ketosteroid isomerase-like protein
MAESKKQIVEKINKAFADNNPEEFLSNCTEDVVWTMVGEKTNNGKKAIREWMASMKDMEAPKFTVDQIVAEGDSVVCYGDMSMKDESGKLGRYSYCDAYRFSGDKITELRSFIVKHKMEGEKSGQASA